MEKYFLLGVVIMVVILNLSVVAEHKMPAMMEECKTKEGVTDEDFKSLRNQDQPKPPAIMCYFTCLAEKSGKIANNQLNTEGILNSIKTLPNYSPDMEKDVNEILAECKNIADADRCIFGSKVMTCLKDGAKKRGVKGVVMPHGRS